MKTIALIVLACVVVAGCERAEEAAAEAVAAPAPAAAEASSESVEEKAAKVLARVDERSLTVGDVAAMVELRCALGRIRSKRFKASDEERVRRQLAKSSAGHFIQQELLLKYASANGIAATAQEVEEYRRRVAAAHRVKSFPELLARLAPEQQALLESETQKELTAELATKRIMDGADTTIAEEEISKVYSDVAKRNELAAATNALVYATATNVYERILKDELTFEEAVEDYSEAEETENGGEWNEFQVSDLDEEWEKELKSRLPSMTGGDVTPPIESDNGLAIVKVVSIGEQDGPGGKGQKTYRLARVFFRLPMFMETPTREELEEALREYKRTKRFEEVMNELGDASRVEKNGQAVKR